MQIINCMSPLLPHHLSQCLNHSKSLNKNYKKTVIDFGQFEEKRVIILKAINEAILNKKKLFILDEVTVGLDLNNCKRVWSLFNFLYEKMGMKAIVVDHHEDYKADIEFQAHVRIDDKEQKRESLPTLTLQDIGRMINGYHKMEIIIGF